MLEDGHLEFLLGDTGRRIRCGRIGAAVWMALRQHEGQCAAAADMLAELWDIDPVNMRAEVDIWVEEWCDAGLVRVELP